MKGPRTLALALLGLFPAAAQTPEAMVAFDLTSVGQATTVAGERRPAGMVGCGIQVAVLFPLAPRHTLRLDGAFNGTRLGSLDTLSFTSGHEGGDLNVLWRRLRLGLEHEVQLGRGAARPYLFYGGGAQESWLAVTEGSLLGVAAAIGLSAVTNVDVQYDYSLVTTDLDRWSGYLTAGVGLRFRGGGFVEFRMVSDRHWEYRDEGLALDGRSPLVTRRGFQTILSIGVRP